MKEKIVNDSPSERQQWESAKAYEAFKEYLASRSIRQVAKKLNKSSSLIGRWSRENHWGERTRDYDNELERESRLKDQEECRKMRERHIAIAGLMEQKAVEALKEIDTKALKPKDIKDFIVAATELERVSRGGDEELAEEEIESDDLSEAWEETVMRKSKELGGDEDGNDALSEGDDSGVK